MTQEEEHITRANPNPVGLHYVGTGKILCSALSLSRRRTFADWPPGAPTSCEKRRLGHDPNSFDELRCAFAPHKARERGLRHAHWLAPCFAIQSRMSGPAIARPISLESLSTTAAGVLAGAQIPYQIGKSNLATHASAIVGTFGSKADGRGPGNKLFHPPDDHPRAAARRGLRRHRGAPGGERLKNVGLRRRAPAVRDRKLLARRAPGPSRSFKARALA